MQEIKETKLIQLASYEITSEVDGVDDCRDYENLFNVSVLKVMSLFVDFKFITIFINALKTVFNKINVYL